MRTVGLALLLLGAFWSFANAQTGPNPGNDLLRAIKTLGDSGRSDDPVMAAAVLHLSYSAIDQSTSSGDGRGTCLSGGSQFDISYIKAVSDNNQEVTVHISGELRCHQPNQNQGEVYIVFDSIPTPCISKAQIEAVFPTLGPGTGVSDTMFQFGGWQGDFSYSTPRYTVNFLMSRPRRVRGGGFDHEPSCLAFMALSSTFQFGPLHNPSFLVRPPTRSHLGVISPAVSYQKPQIDQGLYLLRIAKAIVDSGKADDPNIVANLLHTPLKPLLYDEQTVVSCVATPDFQNEVSATYYMTDESWFHSSASGVLKPSFLDNVSGQAACKESAQDGTGAWIQFADISSYTCISEAQIKSVFPGILPPQPASGWGPADLEYVNAGATLDFKLLSSAEPWIHPAPQPNCLDEIEIHSSYPLGVAHKLDLGN